MIKKPYIFLSQNFSRRVVDGNGNDISGQLNNIDTVALPLTLTFFLSDRWGTIKNHNLDTLILRDTNLQNISIEAADSAGNYSELFNVQGNTDSTVMFSAPAPVTTSSLRITIPAGGNPQQVKVGQIGFFNHIAELFALTDGNFKRETNQGSYRTLSGDIVFYGDYQKWEAKIKIENLPQEQFDALNAAIMTDNALTVIPFKDFDPTAIYECYVSPEFSYEVDRKTALYSATLEAKEL
ncbi:hypothetical protein [Candidatus Avelusimicrobium fimicolum]|uniref:hypothetical protein n=1 Tax=Candidatus Avelusimicrobium fimicolum TaxID=3416216 RepID=UPI003D0AF91F